MKTPMCDMFTEFDKALINWNLALASAFLYLFIFIVNIFGLRTHTIFATICFYLPLAIMVILSGLSFSLPGASLGIKDYLTGNPDEPWKPFSNFSIWVSAQAQSFFSIGYSSALFPTYSSYRHKYATLIK